MAYGYICLQHDDEDVITELHELVTAFAEAEGLALQEIYVDRNVRPGQTVRPGLVVLLDAVVRCEAGCVVVVPMGAHLSPEERVRGAMEVEMEMLGGRIVVVDSRRAPVRGETG
ncbi:hypothetical protein MXD62_16975 [Frankia sp. Mgl5]|uniref:hypothetical protein n=1 Tax=Frankia sp. Mgl5 TaxID=2933793 RepID=UPI002010A7E6|nr:hypothetical protein [Frankia sp. Mgl5]MCK9928851.1 hypothetical protein [Frankia sp. Mgl5]